MKLENRVAIVTGGANGIGRGICLGLAKEGADVVVADIEIETANGVVDEIKALGRKTMAIKTDVTKSKDAKQMAKATLGEFGKIDILVNCAGQPARDRQSLFHESKEEVWDYVIGVNLKGKLNCTRAVINHMIERRSGKIVSIASVAGEVGRASLVDYSAAMGGVISFTKALAKEVASYGINVNCVSPASIETRGKAFYPKEHMEQNKETTGMGRMGKPEDIANMVVFLVSDEASFITGQNHNVAGLRNLGGRR